MVGEAYGAHPVEIGHEPEMLQNFETEGFRLGAGQRYFASTALYAPQKRRDAGIHPVFLPAQHGIALPVELYRAGGALFIQPCNVLERPHQRRAYKSAHFSFAGLLHAQSAERMPRAVDYALAGFGERAVKVEKMPFIVHEVYRRSFCFN